MKISLVYLILLIAILKLSDGVNFPWMYYLPYGEDVTLRPLYKNKTESVIVTSCKWITPKQMVLSAANKNYDINKYFIDTSNCELTIFNNQKDTNGIYHCIVNEIFISKAMLNVHGAPKESLLDEYTPNIIAGVSTAGVIVALFVITCSIYKFRYKKLDKKTPESTELVEIKPTNVHTNETFESDENKTELETNEESLRF